MNRKKENDDGLVGERLWKKTKREKGDESDLSMCGWMVLDHRMAGSIVVVNLQFRVRWLLHLSLILLSSEVALI